MELFGPVMWWRRSGVGMDDLVDSATDTSSFPTKLFISDNGGATSPGSAAVKAFTEG